MNIRHLLNDPNEQPSMGSDKASKKRKNTDVEHQDSKVDPFNVDPLSANPFFSTQVQPAAAKKILLFNAPQKPADSKQEIADSLLLPQTKTQNPPPLSDQTTDPLLLTEFPRLGDAVNIHAIDPENMSERESLLLGEFLSLNTNASFNFFHHHQSFSHKGELFILTHSLLARKCSSSMNDFHYEVIDHTDKLGSGSFATVYGIKGTVNIHHYKAVFTKGKARVIKEQIHSEVKNPLEKLYLEFLFSPIHLHMKAPIVLLINSIQQQEHKSLTVMNRVDGCELFTAFIEHPQSFSTEELLQIILNLSDAILQQVHDHNVIHRDLKLENIMLNALLITIIDYGLAKHNVASDKDFVGTQGYIPPEAEYFISTEKRDIYAFGIMLCIFFGADSPDVEQACVQEEKGLTVSITSLFSTNFDLSTQDKISIEAFLKKMRHPKLDERPSVEQIFDFFNQVRLNVKLKKLNIQAQNGAHHMISAFELASQLKKDLNLIAKCNFNISDSSMLARLKSKMLDAINQVNDHPEAIEEFIAAINIRHLNGIKDKTALISHSGKTLDLFHLNIQALKHLLQKTKHLQCDKYENLTLKQTNLALKITNSLNKLEKYKITFANIFELNDKFKEKLKILTRAFSEIEAEATQLNGSIEMNNTNANHPLSIFNPLPSNAPAPQRGSNDNNFNALSVAPDLNFKL